MIAKNDYRQSDVLTHIVLVAFLFSAFGFLSYKIGWNSAEKAGGTAQSFAAFQAEGRSDVAPEYADAQPDLLSQQMNDQINYSDTGE